LIRLTDYIADFSRSPLSPWADLAPWELVTQAPGIVRQLLAGLSDDDYEIHDEIAVHRTAVVEAGAVLKAPLIIGAHCFIAAGAYLRGGCWVDEYCIFGPGAELKTSFVFSGSKLREIFEINNHIGYRVLKGMGAVISRRISALENRVVNC
jgi:NDP-sugar pyrophosphorylase family protein